MTTQRRRLERLEEHVLGPERLAANVEQWADQIVDLVAAMDVADGFTGLPDYKPLDRETMLARLRATYGL